MTIRTRLTLWYGLGLTLTVAVVATAVWWRDTADLRSSLDEALAVQVADARAALDAGDRDPLREDPARPGIFTIVFDRTGRLMASRSAPTGIDHVPEGISTTRLPGATSDDTLLAVAGPDGRTIVAGTSLAAVDDERVRLAGLLVLVGAIASAASLLGGWLLARRALAPVTLLADEAERIQGAEGALGLRLPVPDAHDEVGRLARTLNASLDRVERTITRQRAFVASASHDLRTPIAALRTELSLALAPNASRESLRAAIVAAQGDVGRLAGLTDDLLGLAAADEGGWPAILEPVPVRAVVADVLERTGADGGGDASPGRRPMVEVDVEDVVVVTDRVRLEQALGNLVANAVRHSPPGGPITIRGRCVTDGSTGRSPTLDIDVLDRGPGVPVSARGMLFVPFARPRSPGGGAGLGLATAEAAVRALGGRIGYRDRSGGGAWFWMRLPVAMPAGGHAAKP